jgi:hypothetical protein
MNLQELFKSKRFWAAIASVAAIVLKDKLPISEDQLQLIIMTIGAWIVGDSLRGVNPDGK